LPTHKPTLKNQKSCFLPTLEKNEQNTENRNRRNRMNCIFRNLKPTEKYGANPK